MKLKALFLLPLCLLFAGFTIPEKLEKKVDKVITSYFESEEFSKKLVAVDASLDAEVPADFADNLFAVQDASGLLGYAYIGNAPSKTATFDYLILFDVDFIVIKSKVLIYREEYGGEIGSKRWLKQFIGKSSDSETLAPYKNISAISGATISVRSMTNAVNDVLQSIGILKERKAI
ncbi:MAG: Na+-translocating ferredoxin:NAD+ oxidoreductase RnfG subunit [Flavobacteriales bacterium]|jgi:Na+-translocating ferredoxin:NAD+ oxidoreductase RnfG subunit